MSVVTTCIQHKDKARGLYVVTHKCIGTPHSPSRGVLTAKASVYILSSMGNNQCSSRDSPLKSWSKFTM